MLSPAVPSTAKATKTMQDGGRSVRCPPSTQEGIKPGERRGGIQTQRATRRGTPSQQPFPHEGQGPRRHPRWCLLSSRGQGCSGILTSLALSLACSSSRFPLSTPAPGLAEDLHSDTGPTVTGPGSGGRARGLSSRKRRVGHSLCPRLWAYLLSVRCPSGVPQDTLRTLCTSPQQGTLKTLGKGKTEHTGQTSRPPEAPLHSQAWNFY